MILEKARGLLGLGGSVTRMLPSFGENYLIVLRVDFQCRVIFTCVRA